MTWRKVGHSEYRTSHYSEIPGMRIANADIDAIYLIDSIGRTFVVYLNGQDEPIHEYRKINNEKS